MSGCESLQWSVRLYVFEMLHSSDERVPREKTHHDHARARASLPAESISRSSQSIRTGRSSSLHAQRCETRQSPHEIRASEALMSAMMSASEARNHPRANGVSNSSASEAPGGVETTPHRIAASPFRRGERRRWNRRESVESRPRARRRPCGGKKRARGRNGRRMVSTHSEAIHEGCDCNRALPRRQDEETALPVFQY